MKTYSELKNINPPMNECFFAFSKDQYEEGIRKHNLEGKKLLDGGYGLIGTRDGILQFYGAYEQIDRDIAQNCEPQAVYDYEFGNHECSYTNDDSEAIQIVMRIFGAEQAKTVKRRFAYLKIE